MDQNRGDGRSRGRGARRAVDGTALEAAGRSARAADPDRVGPLLEAAGFTDAAFEALDEAMWFGADAEDAFGFIRAMGVVERLVHDLDHEDRTEALRRLREVVEAHTTAAGVVLGSAAWLITAQRP